MGSPAPVPFPGPSLDAYKTFLEEKRATCRKLTEALYDYLTLDCNEFERAIADGRIRPILPSFPQPDPSEQLTKAVSERDRLVDQIENYKTKLADGGLPDAVRTSFEIGILGPLEAQLQGVEQWISEQQRRIEKSHQVE